MPGGLTHPYKMEPRRSWLGQFIQENPLDAAALATAPIPILGDIVGLGADAKALYDEPSWLNAGMALAGVIPAVPAGAALRAGKKAVSVVDEVNPFLEVKNSQLAALNPGKKIPETREEAVDFYKSLSSETQQQLSDLQARAYRQAKESELAQKATNTQANNDNAQRFIDEVRKRGLEPELEAATGGSHYVKIRQPNYNKNGSLNKRSPYTYLETKSGPFKARFADHAPYYRSTVSVDPISQNSTEDALAALDWIVGGRKGPAPLLGDARIIPGENGLGTFHGRRELVAGIAGAGFGAPLLMNDDAQANERSEAMAGKVQAPKRTSIEGERHHLAYINDEEAALLRSLGGFGAPMAGSYGLPAFRGVGGDPDSGGWGGGREGNAGRGNRGGERGDARGGFGYAANAREAKARAGVYGANEAGALGVHGARNADEEQNIFNAVRDIRNRGNSFWDNAGNFAAGQLGLNERDPLYDKSFNPATDNQANWGLDPAGLVGGAIGTAVGVPGLGFVADQISQYFDRPLDINLGANVLGGFGAPSLPGSPSPGAPNGGGLMAQGGAPPAGNDPSRMAAMARSQQASLAPASGASASRLDPEQFTGNSAPWGVQALRDLIARGTPDDQIASLLDKMGHHNLSGRVTEYLSGQSSGGMSGAPDNVGVGFGYAPHFAKQPLAQRQALANAINFKATPPPAYAALPGSPEEARAKWRQQRGLTPMPFGPPIY